MKKKSDEELLIEMGYVIRCLDVFDGSVLFRGNKGVFNRNKDVIRLEETYTLSGAKRALANFNKKNTSDNVFYSIEKLSSCYFSEDTIKSPDKNTAVTDAIERIDHCFKRLDELIEGNDFHNGDKMRINEVKKSLKQIKRFLFEI